MAQKINEKRHKPDFGGEPIERIPQTGDTEQDFNKAMVALRDDNYEAFIADLNTLTSDPKVKNLRDAIVDKFNSNEGVQVFFSGETDMPIRNIHPTQFEVDMEKSLKFPSVVAFLRYRAAEAHTHAAFAKSLPDVRKPHTVRCAAVNLVNDEYVNGAYLTQVIVAPSAVGNHNGSG